MAALATAPACADVIEIDGGGTAHYRTGSGQVRWSGGEEDDAPLAVEAGMVPDAALTIPQAGDIPAGYAAIVADLAHRYDLSPRLIAALVWQESRWRADAVSAKGARGLAQLMPATARALGVDAADPRGNLEGCARYLRQMLDLFDGDVERALAAYNAGPGRVMKAGGVPAIAETRAYVASIVDHLSPVQKKDN
ncbi:lytic transglycosylase domain-containing protein [uncultured Sphingomonas sp.]|uniref:lytic transglycosylase domain-containing protein n=1 Tax=uncultured Sphingomonas sp. TaxID=158754 RepID=UPI0025FBE0D0|nr:lytic transglycosylase domain-containing protein [uncultured Sphingomonas sp.]